MEALKKLFGDAALTYEQFAEALESAKDLKLVNLSDGGYVDKDKLTGKIAELAAANETIKSLQEAVAKFDGVDVDKLQSDMRNLQSKYDADLARVKLDSAIDLALTAQKAHDVKAVRPFLNMDAITLDGDKLIGLEEQLQSLRTEKGFLFEAEEQKPGVRFSTGAEHTQTSEGADNFVSAAMRGAGLK